MPKVVLLSLIVLLLLPKAAFGKVNVEINGNEDGSSSDVSIESNTGGRTVKSSTMQNTTDIKINNNGEVKEYHGSDGNIEMSSDDGKTSVKVNNIGASNTNNSNTSKVTTSTNITVNSDTEATASSTPEATKTGSIQKSPENEEKNLSFWQIIKKEINDFFNLFS